MNSYKKALALFLVLMLAALALVGCGASPSSQAPAATSAPAGSSAPADEAAPAASEASGNLVVYTTEPDELIGLIVPGFEQKYGVKVELITAGTGELLKRIESEKENPMADVLLGGSYSVIKAKQDLFESYVSPEDAYVIDGFKNDGITQYKTAAVCLLVNTDLIGDIEVKGYQDLLNPELKGKIAAADAASSSSAFDHLMNMLVDLSPEGEPESEEGWAYVQELLYNIDGKILNGSSAVHKGVVDGEYTVGVTYEDPSCSYVKDGATNVEVVYMEEGVVLLGSSMNIIKGAKNLDNAKLFMDYVLSEEVQSKLGTEACLRPVRENCELGPHMTPLSDLNLKTVDMLWVSENKDRMSAKFTDLMTNVG